MTKPIFVRPAEYKVVSGKKSLWKAEIQLHLCDVDTNPAAEPVTRTLNVTADNFSEALKTAIDLAMTLGHYDQKSGMHWFTVGAVVIKLEWLADIDG